MICVNSDGVDSKRTSAEPDLVQQAGTLPDFVIIGAQKSGTSSLYHLLSQHPYIRPAVRKELHYFSVFFDRGTEWYRSCFPGSGGKSGNRIPSRERPPPITCSTLTHPGECRKRFHGRV